MEFFQTLLCINLVVSSIFVFLVSNPVHSTLYMILGFCNASIILFLLGVQFLSLIFIIIYVGAIAILFLFVIMMLDIKSIDVDDINTSSHQFLIGTVFLILLSSLKVFVSIPFDFNQENHFFFFDSISNLNLIGQLLYNYNNFHFLIAGLILLIAMIGPISLTLNFHKNTNSEVIHKQLSRSDNSIKFFS